MTLDEDYNEETIAIIGDMLSDGRIPERLVPLYGALLDYENLTLAWERVASALRNVADVLSGTSTDFESKLKYAVQCKDEYVKLFCLLFSAVDNDYFQDQDCPVLICHYSSSKISELPDSLELFTIYQRLFDYEVNGDKLEFSNYYLTKHARNH